ncbi:protein YIPF6 [Anthonomus grandis grandis]|uniref:protein YIPF6 n=1 Tax=Anthonomus grandis grandis TaxID=2921223 RepID=UPI0021650CFF|nr:protein YIPF6 [Anthonomus grandis grandis]
MDHTKLEMYDGVDAHVEGEMSVGSNKSTSTIGQPNFNTLDEPIKDTILRDLKAVGIKFTHVLFPKEKRTLLKDWDLWGPLMLCTFMAMILHGDTTADKNTEGGPEFAEVFIIVWIGSMVVTLNSKLLGGNISFFQSICVLGYCLLPTTLALIVCRIILMANEQTHTLFFIRFTVSMVGFAWATYASLIFLGDSQKPGRKLLAVYPIGLFYFIISWLVISHTSS